MADTQYVKFGAPEPRHWVVERNFSTGEINVRINDLVFIRIAYDYRYTHNSHQWELGKTIARSLMSDGDTLIVDGKAIPQETDDAKR